MGHLGGFFISQEKKKIPKKIIEDWFPIENVGEEGRQEKTKAIGRLPSIHQWHARRPSCAMRAIVLESLFQIPEVKTEYDLIKDFLVQFCQRFIPETITLNDNSVIKRPMSISSALEHFLGKIQRDSPLKALDPFAGGGTIPFELANAGFETYATDLNPVALLINKATVEYPIIFKNEMKSVMLPAIQKYARIIYTKLQEQLGEFFSNPEDKDEEILWYVWARQISCPHCGLKIPLLKSLILDEKCRFAILPILPNSLENKEIQFKIGWFEKETKRDGFYKKGSVVCPRQTCGATISKKELYPLMRTKSIEERLIAVYFISKNGQRNYRIGTLKDVKVFKESEKIPLPLTPNLKLPEKVILWRIQNFGYEYIRDMFNNRQYLVATKISSMLKQQHQNIIEEFGEDKAKAILLYLTFGLDRLVDFNSKFSMPYKTRIRNTWTRPGLFMTGLYLETNPICNEIYSGSWLKYFSDLGRVLENIIERHSYQASLNNVKLRQMDAQNLEYADNFFDVIITDPPYYDNVPYAVDSDFFYVWERSVLDSVFPEFFINASTPKDEELIADQYLRGNQTKAKEFYKKGMTRSFSEIYRVLKSNSLAVIIFAHKNTAAWETLLEAFIQSKFVVTATWPVPMESRGKFAALTTASLTSVVLVVARKKPRKPSIYFDKKFKNDIGFKIQQRMQEFWNQNIRGADFFMCGIGPSLKYYSRHDAILDPKTDNPISIGEYLIFIQNIMVNFAVEQISQTAYSGGLDRITQFYLVWRWGYGLNSLPFDEMKILYQALTIDVNDLEKTIIRKKKGKADYECLSPNERFKNLDAKKLEQFTPDSIIDYLHIACFLWEKDERSLLENSINSALLKFGDALWTIAQALHDVLPECHEQNQLQNLLQRYKKFKPRQHFVPKSEKAKQLQRILFPKTETEKIMTPEGEEETSDDEDTESEENNDGEE